MNPEFTEKELRLIYTAVRRFQMEKTYLTSTEYEKYGEILNKLFPFVHTQRKEQST